MKSAESKNGWLQQAAWTLVRSGARYLALPSSVVALSTEVPTIHALPFAPAHIRGIAHLNGDVMPCIDLSRLLGARDAETQQEALVIVSDERKVIVLVDQAVRQLTIDGADREKISVMESEQGGLVLAEWTLNDRNIFLLDPDSLTHFAAQRRQSAGRPGLVADHDAGEHVTGDADQLDNLFLYISVGSQHFALSVMACREIVELGDVSALPGADETIMGLTLLRDVSYLVVDAAACLRVEAAQQPQAVVVNVGNEKLLLAVTAIESVRAVPRHQLRRIGEQGALLSSVIEVPGEPLRAVIAPAQLSTRVPELMRYIPAGAADSAAEAAITRSHRYLLVSWQDELFALSLDGVEQLAPPMRVKPVNSEAFAGMINIDGDVLPVIDSEHFYGCSDGQSAQATKQYEGFVILMHQNLRFAVVLQQAEGIIDVDERDIQKSRAGGDARFTSTLRYNQQLVSELSLQHFSTLVNENLESPE